MPPHWNLWLYEVIGVNGHSAHCVDVSHFLPPLFSWETSRSFPVNTIRWKGWHSRLRSAAEVELMSSNAWRVWRTLLFLPSLALLKSNSAGPATEAGWELQKRVSGKYRWGLQSTPLHVGGRLHENFPWDLDKAQLSSPGQANSCWSSRRKSLSPLRGLHVVTRTSRALSPQHTQCSD